MKFPFVGDAYSARSINVNGSQTINLYPEIEPGNSKSVLALFGTPGTVFREGLAAASPARGKLV